MKGSNADYFIATTVDLLSTGVDIPQVLDIVFFRYMKSPISFYQMVGRGTRLEEDKISFTIYDYTDATRLFGEDFRVKPKVPPKEDGGPEDPEPPVIVTADGFEAEITPAGRYIVTQQDGQIKRVTVEEYKQGIAEHIVQQTATLSEFRDKWVDPVIRHTLLVSLVTSGYSPEIVRQVENMTAYDMYDVLVNIVYRAEPKERTAQAFSFTYKQRPWLDTLPEETKAVILAIANQFIDGGTEAFESGEIFNIQAVRKAGGIAALKKGGNAAELIQQTKLRMFAA
jgi:type I restriction enzyme R subunit